MKVSIVVPTYNVGRYIVPCLQSMITQTYSNIEIIIVNDGSTDDTMQYANQIIDDRIKCINIVNQGVTAARKIGFINSTGDYCMFIDADDILLPDAVEFFIEKAIAGSYDVVTGWYDVVHDSGKVDYPVFNQKVGAYSNVQYITKTLDATADFYTIWIGFYKRNVLNEKVFDIDRFFFRGEDLLTVMGILNNAGSILVTDKIFIHYVYRETSVTKTTTLNVEYIYEYNKFRYTVLKEDIRPLIYFNTLSRIIPQYLRLKLDHKVSEIDKKLIVDIRHKYRKRLPIKLYFQYLTLCCDFLIMFYAAAYKIFRL